MQRPVETSLEGSRVPRDRVGRLIISRSVAHPDAVALSAGGAAITYGQLVGAARRAGAKLAGAGVGPGATVAVCLPRSPDAVLTILGTLFAGAAYVPIDPLHPVERVRAILADSAPAVVVGHPPREALGHGQRTLEAETLLAHDEPPLPLTAWPADLPAYVMYTSGSTGEPKGVVVGRGALGNYARQAGSAYGIAQGDRVLQFAPLHFDASVEEIFATFAAGATLVLRTDAMLASSRRFLEDCARLGITWLSLPTAYWHRLASDVEAYGLPLPPSLHTLIIGGEAAHPERVASWNRLAAGAVRLVNTYGPTETTVVATYADLTGYDGGPVPIGGAVPGLRAAVVAPDGTTAADGEAGELHIGGAGVAQGYLRRPARTAAAFLPDPDGARGGARRYRTGDLVRSVDGSLTFLGRTDSQVKISGQRIEPGEIEAALRRLAPVHDAAVVPSTPGGRVRLTAYVVLRPGPVPSSTELQQALRDHLQEPMIPSELVAVPELPLGTSGKIDHTALPGLDGAVPLASAQPYVAPSTPVEEWLARTVRDVLGCPPVGMDDDILAMGGNSLAVMQITARVRERHGCDVALRDVLADPTVAGLARLVEEATGGGDAAADRPPAPRHRPPRLEGRHDAPTALAQERVLFLNELDPGNPAYHFQMSLEFEGDLDVAALRRATAEMIRRHEILRTTFPVVGGEPVQRIHPPYEPEIPVVDLRDLTPAEAEAEFERMALEAGRRPFDLTALPLLRWLLVRLAEDHHRLLHVEHHLVHDGWSLAVYLRELAACYRALATGGAPDLPDPSTQFAAYAEWQRAWLESSAAHEQAAFWREALAGAPPMTAIPTDRPRSDVQTFAGGIRKHYLSPQLCDDLERLSRHAGATRFIVMMAAFQALVHHMAGQDDLVVGTSVANRSSPVLEGMIGMVVNNVALRVDTGGNPTVSELVGRVRRAMLDAFANADLPFEEVVAQASTSRHVGHNPLFQVMFSFHDSAIPTLDLPEVEATLRYRTNATAKFDLNVIANPKTPVLHDPGAEDGGMVVEWEYNSDLFDAVTVDRLTGRFARLLEAFATDPRARLDDLDVLSDGEREELRAMAGGGRRPDLPASTGCWFLDRFEERVAATPDALAVVAGPDQLTYRALDRRANQVARRLRRAGVRPESVVGVLARRRPGTIVSILAAMKAGAAYVPLDADTPAERVRFVLRDSGSAALLAPPERTGAFAEPGVAVVPVPEADEAQAGPGPLPRRVPAQGLAYVIYTSGSTGTPKGVAVSRAALAHYVEWCLHAYGLAAGQRVPVHTPFGFDLCITSVLPPLLAGATLDLLPDGIAGLEALGDRLRRGEAALVKLTPSHLRVLAGAGALPARGSRPVLVVGGEAFSARDAAPWAGRSRIVNEYGPTEAVVGCTVAEWPGQGAGAGDAAPSGSVPIGRPVGYARAYVTGAGDRLAAHGAVGDLHVGGPALALGYVGRPGLTADRFRPDPFGDSRGARRYRTGDRVRWLASGQLDYLGRGDRQVKVRGYRVEPGEVESVLAELASASAAVVVAADHPSGEQGLYGYVVAPRGGLDVAALRRAAAARLPGYMVPWGVTALEEVPLTPAGKVDHAALPAPADAGIAGGHGHAPPAGPLEEALAGVWSDVLRVDGIGRTDNFFDLGGRSLAATRVVVRVRQRLGADLSLRELFEAPTVAGLAAILEPRVAGAAATAGAGPRGAGPEAAAAPPQPDRSVEELSDDEVRAELEALLARGEPGV